MRETRLEVSFDALAQFTADGFAFVDRDGTIAAWSDAAGCVTEVSRADAVGTRLATIFRNADDVFRREDRIPCAVRLTFADDAERALRASVLPLDGGWLLSFGPQRRYREIEQLKSEIIAAVSHELKTPIATIKAYATTLRDNPPAIQSERADYLATIEEQADRLTFAVDGLLLAARVETDHLLERRVCIPLDDVANAALAMLAPWKPEHRLEWRVKDVTICGDPELLREVLVHLIENALKFSPANSPVLIEGSSNDSETIVRVRDRGIGIDEEHLPYIFDRFYRAETNLTASTGGSGLGLYITLSIVRAHGGSISVESLPGTGTTFTVMLPVRS